MYTLVIGRAFPRKETGMMGIFEFEQAVALNKHGMKTVYAFCDTRSIKRLRKYNYEEFNDEGIPIYGYHYPIGGLPIKLFNHLKFMKYRKMIKRILRENGKPSIIHIHYPLLTINHQIFKSLKQLDVPIVITEHWSKVQTNELEKHRQDLLEVLLKESDKFIVVGKLLKESILKQIGFNADIEIIPNMIPSLFNYSVKNKNLNEKINILTIGRLIPGKEVELLLNSFHKAFKDIKNVNLHIIGDGPLFSKLEKEIERLDLREKVFLNGFLPREMIAKKLKESDVYVSASSLETFGVPFVEAMACGKPVIAAKGGPLDEYILQNHGLLFESQNIESLMSKLVEMVENVERIDSYQISKNIISEFSEEAISRRLINAYKML